MGVVILLGAAPAAYAISDEMRGRLQELKNDRAWDQAIFVLQAYREKAPDDREAVLELANAFINTEEYSKALHLVNETIKDGECLPCYALRWDALHEMRFRSEGVKTIIAAEAKRLEQVYQNRSSAELYAVLFQGYRLAKAEPDQYRIAEHWRTEFPDPAQQEGLIEDDFAAILRNEARLAPEEFIARYPGFQDIDVVYGLVLQRRVTVFHQNADLKPAVVEWIQKWLTARPQSRRAYFHSARVLQEIRGSSKDIRRYLKNVLKLARRSPNLDRDLLWTQEEWNEVLSQSTAQARAALAWQEFLDGKKWRAERHFRALEDKLADDHQYWYRRARVLAARKKPTHAAVALEKSLEFGHAREQALYGLASLQHQPNLTLEEVRQKLSHEKAFPVFHEITKAVGLEGVPGRWIAWGDFDGDGDEDLLVGNGGLYENRLIPDGKLRFVNVSKKRGLGAVKDFRFGIWADINGDGAVDLFLAEAEDRQSHKVYPRIFINRLTSQGRFVDETKTYLGVYEHLNTSAAAFGDFNGDGYLDLYLANGERPGEPLGRGTRHMLFVNQRGRRFKDISRSAGCVSAEPMCGRGVVWGDYDNDGRADVYVANYRLDPNFLFHNNGNGTFTELAKSAGVRGRQKINYFGHSIGAEFGDLDNDGDLDLVVANLAHPRGLAYSDKTNVFINDLSRGTFQNVFAASGIAYEETHSEPVLGDLDNDGDLDLILTATYAGHRLTVYQNNGQAHFNNVSFTSGIEHEGGWGGALADMDNDGDLDFAVAGDSGVHIFRNDLSTAAHWLQVKAPIGTRVTALSSDGKRQIREVEGGKGTGNQNAAMAAFGFGANGDPVDLLIRLPSGTQMVRSHVAVDQKIAP